MEARFFERNGVDFVAITTDTSTIIDLVAKDEHKARFSAAWDDYCNPERAHNADGTFRADDKSTPKNNEAYKTNPRKKKLKRKIKP